MKKIIVLSTSIRHGSNSDILADEFIKGAIEAGAQVEKITLSDKSIAFCKGCLACQRLGKCVIDDDANVIADKLLEADTVLWVTPVYYYSCSGQMKTLIDRLNPLFPKNYKFRDVYLIATAAENEEDTFDGTITALKGWVDCFEKTCIKGTLLAGGVNAPNEIKSFDNYLKQAYAMGSRAAE